MYKSTACGRMPARQGYAIVTPAALPDLLRTHRSCRRDPASWIAVEADPERLHGFRNLQGEIGRAGRRVSKLE
jgi:hypothetical protein